MKLNDIWNMAEEIDDLIDDVLEGHEGATTTFPIRVKYKGMKKTLRVTVTAQVEK